MQCNVFPFLRQFGAFFLLHQLMQLLNAADAHFVMTIKIMLFSIMINNYIFDDEISISRFIGETM